MGAKLILSIKIDFQKILIVFKIITHLRCNNSHTSCNRNGQTAHCALYASHRELSGYPLYRHIKVKRICQHTVCHLSRHVTIDKIPEIIFVKSLEKKSII